jgi:tryptophan 2,3-dioxygenase
MGDVAMPDGVAHFLFPVRRFGYMVTMTATKMLRYSNRQLKPGEDFEAKSHRDMKVLLATRKAKLKRPEVEIAAPPVEVQQKIEAAVVPPPSLPPPGEAELIEARLEYKRVVGRPPYHSWDVATLRHKIANANAS